jgi:hypothetical protein
MAPVMRLDRIYRFPDNVRVRRMRTGGTPLREGVDPPHRMELWEYPQAHSTVEPRQLSARQSS